MEAEKATAIPDLVRDRFKSEAPEAPGTAAFTEALVAEILGTSVRGEDDPGAVLDQVLEGVVKGVNAAGAPLWLASRGAMIGALRSSGACGLDHEQILERLPAVLVRAAEAGGGDFGAAAKGAVEGAIEGCAITGIAEERAASIAATAAYRAARALRESAAIRIRHITTPAVRGVPTRIDTDN